MNDENQEIVNQYFQEQKICRTIHCQKCIFEPDTKTEWFFENHKWCYFEFYCEDKDYRLIRKDEKYFASDCEIRKMSYEIMMLLSFIRLRGVVTVEKEDFSRYITRFEKEKSFNLDLTLEKFNFDIKKKEEEEFKRSDKTLNRILAGCMSIIIVTIVLFGILVISYFFASPAQAKSKYSQDFIKNFAFCTKFKETKYNSAYNSNSTYEIQGYQPDGSCVYVETNEWLKGKNITTCRFSYAQQQEYLKGMIYPDEKYSAEVKGMAVVGGHEEVVFLKYFNMPVVCKTEAKSK